MTVSDWILSFYCLLILSSSNLGMGVWDSDEDANPPTDNSMEESREWPLNKDFHGY